MIPDYSILTQFTVAEIDVIQDRLGIDGWAKSNTRHMLLRREEMEVDVVQGIVDNNFGLPLMSKKAQQISQGRTI